MARALIDRDDERESLQQLARRRQPSLALVTGRRRIGKTYLLAKAWESASVLFFTATRTTADLNRRQLVSELARWSGEALSPHDYPTWRSVFQAVVDITTRRARRDPSTTMVAILDEFQYLADAENGLAEVASELNAVWERAISFGDEPPFVIVLAGSAVSTMESLATGGAPLYGRFALQMTLHPFNYWHTAQLATFASLRDRARCFGVFGGTPRYLAAIDSTMSFAVNVGALLLSPRGEVRMLVETALDQEEGLRDVHRYSAIVRAVADGCTGRNDIAQRTGITNDQGLRDKIGKLIELGYLESRNNADAKKNEPVRYAVADPAFRFYHRFVAPNISMLERNTIGEVWTTMVEPYFDAYMGHEFERIVPQAYDRLRSTKNLPMVKRWGRWEGVDHARRSLEIDIVADLADARTMTGAIKWDAAPVGPAVHIAHLDMLERAASSGRAWAHAALKPDAPLFYVAAGGFTDAFREEVERSGRTATCWSLEDLYAE